MIIRVKISNFIRKHKNKIQDLLTKLIMVAIVIFIATIILSAFRNTTNTVEEDSEEDIYNPKETIIKGSDISEKQYQTDSNMVDVFLDYCNKGNVEEAYNMLTDACKKELYPTIETFKTNYYNNIFQIERVPNIQAWISTSKYTVYKLRYTNNMLATGTYEKDNVYEDYITLSKIGGTQKISIGNLVFSEECNSVTEKDFLEATVINKKQYISREEYEIKIKNKTEKTILLDTLEDYDTINLSASAVDYRAFTNEIFKVDLMLNPWETKTFKISFKKNLSSNNKSEKIEFLNIIKDYDTYIENPTKYNDVASIKIRLED